MWCRLFFSSRRRHTRFDCDWSSDVCSSDLGAPVRDPAGSLLGAVLVFRDITARRQNEKARGLLAAIVESSEDAIVSKNLDGVRSEERRVGKECRSRWSPYH